MAQTYYDGTAGVDYFDASGETALDIAVFRGLGAGDTAIGGAGADRVSLLAKGTIARLGAGNDLFLTTLDTRVVDSAGHAIIAARDTIDGGAGTDTLNITFSAGQLTDAVKAELVRLQTYFAGDTTQHFVSDLLHVDMVNVESGTVRLDGAVKTLAEVAPSGPVGTLIDFEDGVLNIQGIAGTIAAGYHGFDWTSPVMPAFYSQSFYHNTVGSGPLPASGDIGLGADINNYSPLQIVKHGGGDFVFSQADVGLISSSGDFSATAAVTFTGSRGGVTIGTATVTADETHWQTVQVNWGTIDTLVVSWAPDDQNRVAMFDNMWLA